MAILLTSGNPLGLRAVGSGGRTAAASYDQIVRTLRQTLGPTHAALFAEPSQRTGRLDWFADVETRDKPVPLSQAPTDVRDRGLDRLQSLVRDIEAKAADLQKSDRQDERILGDMLARALDIPDEDAVYLVGEQPVMTFWGYVKDKGRPPVSPIETLLRLRSQAIVLKQPDATVPPVLPKPDIMAQPIRTEAAAKQSRPAAFRLPPAALWAALAALLLICGFELARGCAAGLPHALTSWLSDTCPAPVENAVADERARQADYQTEYDGLLREAALARRTCEATQTPPQEPSLDPIPDPIRAEEPAPILKNPPIPIHDDQQQQMKLPPVKTDTIDFLEGCWKAHEGLTERVADRDTGKKLNISYCFNKDGSGSRIIRYVDDSSKCIGPAKAAWNGESLTVDLGNASCDKQHGPYVPAVDTCRRGEEGIAKCDEFPVGKTKAAFVDFPFTRTDEQP